MRSKEVKWGKMRVCFVGVEIVPSQRKAFVGGLVNNVIRLAKGLSENGYDVSIVTSDINHVLPSAFVTSWGTIYPIHIGGGYASFRGGAEFVFKSLYALQNYRKSFDILHVHSAYAVLGIIPQLIRIIKRVPTVFTLYSPLMPNFLKVHDKFYRHFSCGGYARIFLNKVGKVVAVSNNVKRSLIELGLREEEISVIPPAVDTAVFNPHIARDEKRKELGIDEETPMILYCGNFAKWKGVDILIRSMVKVVQLFPDTKLTLAWGEPYNWYNERKVMISEIIRKSGLKSHVIEVGICEDIEKLMAASDVFVAPFITTEGVADYPLSILEAMACGRPVVSTNLGGIPEIVVHGENGFLVEPGDSMELAEAICKLLGDRVRAEGMGKKGAEYVLKNHSIEVITAKLEALYKEL